MSSEFHFQGRLEYASRTTLEEALEQLRRVLADEDEDLLEIFEDQWDGFFGVDGAALDIDVKMSGPSDWWFALETIVAILGEDAVGGFIDGQLDGAKGKTRYHAGGEEEELA